ncbi:MAG: DUF4190 domain-containing protein, partial [Pirellulales bacterium]
GCGNLLVADDVVGGGNVICGRCRLPFVYRPSALARRLSRKAVASLVLATASLFFFCLTAIPALVLGGLALIEIHRDEDRLRGRRLAVAGIVMSVLFGFLSLIVWALLLPALQMLRHR